MEAKVETTISSNYNALKHVYKRCRISCIHCSNRHSSSDSDGGMLLMLKSCAAFVCLIIPKTARYKVLKAKQVVLLSSLNHCKSGTAPVNINS